MSDRMSQPMDKDNAPSVAVTGADGNGQASVSVSADPTTYGGAATGMPLRVGLPEDPPSYQGTYLPTTLAWHDP